MANGDTIKLGVFGHTHMDEFHLLRTDSFDVPVGVPVKVVGAVSPVDGNLPSFTVGQIDPATSALRDYVVYKASNTTGIDTHWGLEYSFDKTYGVAGFTPGALADLVAQLRQDIRGERPKSRAYQDHFLKGSDGKKLSPSWPAYVCSLDNVTAQGFTECLCGRR